MSKDNDVLKACPFCESSDIKFSNKTTSGGKKRHYAMFCNSCHAYGPRRIVKVDKDYYLSWERKEANHDEDIEAWNAREVTK